MLLKLNLLISNTLQFLVHMQPGWYQVNYIANVYPSIDEKMRLFDDEFDIWGQEYDPLRTEDLLITSHSITATFTIAFQSRAIMYNHCSKTFTLKSKTCATEYIRLYTRNNNAKNNLFRPWNWIQIIRRKQQAWFTRQTRYIAWEREGVSQTVSIV